MLFKPDLIVYLWMFPVFLFFVLPVLFLPVIVLGEKMFATRLQLARGEDKREFPRQKIDGIIAHVSDGVNCCQGAVTDISQRGVCLVGPRDWLDQKTDRLGVLLTGTGETFHMRVKPLWQEDRGEELSIGAAIEETLGSWDAFAENARNTRFTTAA